MCLFLFHREFLSHKDSSRRACHVWASMSCTCVQQSPSSCLPDCWIFFSLSLLSLTACYTRTQTHCRRRSSSSWSFGFCCSCSASNRLAIHSVRVCHAMAPFHTFSLILFGDVFFLFFSHSLSLSNLALPSFSRPLLGKFGALVALRPHTFIFPTILVSAADAKRGSDGCC